MDDDAPSLNTLKSQRLVNRRGIARRSELLKAAVGCLARLGYAATTIEAVMAAAGASRGSVLHQFPTRLDLMEAAADSAMHVMLGDFQRRLDCVECPKARLMRTPDIAWEVQNETPAFAVSEVARQAGMARPADIVVPTRLMISSLRGLTIELMFDGLRPTILDALEILKSNHIRLMETLLRAA
jgi:AcrR family transcriptional regulator